MDYRKEKQLWKVYYAVTLQDVCDLYYKAHMKYYHEYISIEVLYVECCQSKYDKLTKSLDEIFKRESTWNVDDVRMNVDATMQTVYRIRLAPNVTSKRRKLEDLQVFCFHTFRGDLFPS